jgi:hypothetical protein
MLYSHKSEFCFPITVVTATPDIADIAHDLLGQASVDNDIITQMTSQCSPHKSEFCFEWGGGENYIMKELSSVTNHQ